MKKFLSLALVLISTVVVHAGWTTDFKAAVATARSENKMVLLNFTGSDWCPACKLLDEDVFPAKSFQTFADKHYVLVTVDFPQGTSLPDALAAQNEALHAQYNIEGFPTLLVIDPNGKELGRQVGYIPGSGPDAVIEQLKGFEK